jgi:hypothetical protein
MIDVVERFLAEGHVVVEGALDPGFCDDVVAEGFRRLGATEDDPGTWPTGWINLPPTTVHDLATVAPAAAAVLHELVGPPDTIAFGGLPDNLIVNFPGDAAAWWPPSAWRDHLDGFHKDGDWFRHFLDSPEQAILGLVLWRDVEPDQGPTYAVVDSIGPIARFLARHPEGIDPGGFPHRELLADCHDVRPLVGRKGTVIWAHPWMVHAASVNRIGRPRVISNTAVMLRQPMRFAGAGRSRTPVEESVLHALGVASLDFVPTRERRRVVSERERRWEAEQAVGR